MGLDFITPPLVLSLKSGLVPPHALSVFRTLLIIEDHKGGGLMLILLTSTPPMKVQVEARGDVPSPLASLLTSYSTALYSVSYKKM